MPRIQPTKAEVRQRVQDALDNTGVAFITLPDEVLDTIIAAVLDDGYHCTCGNFELCTVCGKPLRNEVARV